MKMMIKDHFSGTNIRELEKKQDKIKKSKFKIIHMHFYKIRENKESD